MALTIPIDYAGQGESKKFSRMVLGDMMGKGRKASKGYSSGIQPKYLPAVESEGFCISDRVNAVLNTSQGSSAPNTKHIGLNADGYGSSVVPIRFLSLSEMPPSERRDLGARLKSELERVRKLQRKIASFSIDSVVQSTADVQTCQKEPGKKKCPPGKNGPRTKGGSLAARKSESVKQNLPQDTNIAILMKQCETLLDRLMQHQHAWIFSEPVDIVKHNIPDYFNVIKHPMDLGTVKSKLLSNQYSNPMEFVADVRLTFKNARTYNPPGHDVHIMAEVMSKHFEVRWKSIERKIPAAVDDLAASKSSVIVEPEIAYVPPAKKQKTLSGENKDKDERNKRVMPDAEKHKLGIELEELVAELPDNIIKFMKDNTSNGSPVGEDEDEIEIDIDSLSDDTLFKLRKLLDEYLLEKQRKRVSQPSETEMQKDSKFSSLPDKPRQGDFISQSEYEQADEEVDIGGNHPPPTSSSSPMNNIMDGAQMNVNGIQRSSSGGSLSSDTDSENSHCEIDVSKNLDPATTAKETIDTRAEEKEPDTHVPNSGEFSNGHAEQNSATNSSCSEIKQGESARPERQVSPDKLYRAALLRSRFADIIIKAQENSLEKGEKPDPKKLKLEREELERRRKEEKARLQAEAKAVEEARIKAEADAAAETRRKIKLEREAARQALQQMEKTVDINENSRFMEDLEMFRSVPDEHTQSLIVVASPESSQICLGSFKFQASSNPLEQLGLYMKNDEEEEEEIDPESIRQTPNDPEEGEID